MAKPKEVLLDISNNVATVTLNRPQRGNALNPSMNSLLLDTFESLRSNPEVRVVVLTGSGKYFCTGMDLGAPPSDDKDGDSIKEGFQNGRKIYETIKRFPKPVIAKVNGPALGGGVGLVFTADIRIVYQDAYFALTEVKRGIIPAIISEYIVPDLGMFKSLEYMLTGRKIPAKEALGKFITAVAPDTASLDALVKEYADELLSSAPGAMADIKELVRTVGRENSEVVSAHIEKAFIKMMNSEEAMYGIMSFMKKEKPDWGKRAKL